jgi:hypothetical protein
MSRVYGSVLVRPQLRGLAQPPSEQERSFATLLWAQPRSGIQPRKPSPFCQPLGLQPCWLAILLCRLLQISARRKLSTKAEYDGAIVAKTIPHIAAMDNVLIFDSCMRLCASAFSSPSGCAASLLAPPRFPLAPQVKISDRARSSANVKIWPSRKLEAAPSASREFVRSAKAEVAPGARLRVRVYARPPAPPRIPLRRPLR